MILPAEFDAQDFVQLTWPHRDTDWAYIYNKVVDCYCNMAREIAKREPLLIVAQHPTEVVEELKEHNVPLTNIRMFGCKTNDTWARDHGFITCLHNGQKVLMDFQFNGWGMKFASNHDNQINRNLHEAGAIEGIYTNCLDFVLEGGSIESDGKGTILTTTPCLMAPNRNDVMNKAEIEIQLCQFFNAERVLWLDHSWLAGDDTDGHVDTVARFCSVDTIAYVQCLDQNDEHYAELHAMEEELKAFRTLDGKPYNLIPLPMPRAIYDEDEVDECGNPQRLPATYANFLIMNSAVLMPTYGDESNDKLATSQLQKAFPEKEIIGINCEILVRQHGSLHCCTMQYPK
ncbi:MAG: agmatine deiminase family protein [Bacteroidaceae bacterium]|nr:agmatine deiminase family protein [Bacteroidaceae bacterium]